MPGKFGVKTGTALKPSKYHTLGHLSWASLLDLSTLSSFQLILAHFEPARGHTCTVSYTPDTKTSPHYYVPHYVQKTCHNLQRLTEHMIRAYTAQWTQTAVCLSHGGRLSFDCITSNSTYIQQKNFAAPCASDSRGWHTYLVHTTIIQ